MKRMISWLLTVMAAMVLAGAAAAVETPEEPYPTGISGEARWTLQGDTMYITGEGMLSGVSNADCQPWEYFQDQIRHVVVEEGVTLIGDVIFAHTYQLETVTIADSVKEICEGAFRNCYALKSVKLPARLEKLGNFAFAYCENLGPMELPDTLTQMGESVFTGCSAMSGIRLPKDLYEIGQMNFDSCMALTEVTIPAGVGFLRHASFPNCFNLKKVVFEGDMPNTNGDPFYMGPEDLVIYCYDDAKGWEDPLFYTYPVVKLQRENAAVEEQKVVEQEKTASGGEMNQNQTEVLTTGTVTTETAAADAGGSAGITAGTEGASTDVSAESGSGKSENAESTANSGEKQQDEAEKTKVSVFGPMTAILCVACAVFSYVVASFVYGKDRLKR